MALYYAWRRKVCDTAFLYIFLRLIYLFALAVWILMILRVVLDFLPLDDENPLLQFVYLLTEPFVVPVRSLLNRWIDVEGLPVDISFFISMLLLGLLVQLVRR